jgi:osmotically-inducible protein OsmY
MNRTLKLFPAALVAAAALAGCNPSDNRSAGQKLDQAVANAKSEAGQAKRSAEDTGAKIASTAGDAMITTKINAALAADDELKATKIDVDTRNGHVVLTGTAPTDSSRERATVLARAVEGVVAVDNRLTLTKG